MTVLESSHLQGLVSNVFLLLMLLLNFMLNLIVKVLELLLDSLLGARRVLLGALDARA